MSDLTNYVYVAALQQFQARSEYVVVRRESKDEIFKTLVGIVVALVADL